MTNQETISRPEGSRPVPRPRRRRLRFGAAALALAVAIALAPLLGEQLPRMNEWVRELGFLGPIVFILTYAAAVVLFVPGSLLTVAAGTLFGLVEGSLYVFAAAVLGSTLAFLISRYGARNWVKERLAENARFEAIDRAIGEDGLKITFLLRLSPLFPFSIMNYALGLTSVRLVDYWIASLGMIPWTVFYVYVGQIAGDVAIVAGAAEDEARIDSYWLTALGLAATLALTLILTRLARRALGEIDSTPSQAPNSTG